MFERLMKNEYFREVFSFLKEKKIAQNSYLVGGTIRDFFLNRELKDLDFAIDGDSIKLAKDFSRSIQGSFVLLDEDFAIGRIVKNNITIDFSKLRGDSIESDLSDRDFTINAIALNLASKTIVDPFEGLKDLKSKIIRMVKEENLRNDPLRILRAYRFHATLGFEIEEETRNALRRNSHFIKRTARERIKEELWKILSIDESLKSMSIMIEDNIFRAIFKSSELLPLKTYLLSVKIIEEILKNPKKVFSNCKNLSSSQIICLKFASFFDFQAPSLIKQIKPSKKEEKLVEKIVESGNRIKKVENLLDKVSFIRDFEAILYPALIYGLSKDPLAYGRAWFYREIEEFYRKIYLKNKKKLPLIKGVDILALGFEPSELIGEIIQRIEFLTLAGKISTKTQALESIKNHYLSKISPP